MYTGELWLDYDDGEYEAHWRGDVTECIVRDNGNRIVLAFSGHHPDYGEFHGSCDLHREEALFIGRGSFIGIDGAIAAAVSATFSQEGNAASISGLWHEEADNSPYDLTIELIEVDQP